jgi:1-deoxyxylulose-5-phosphate synthase
VSQVKGVAAPIVGATKVAHIDDAVASLQVELTADEVASLQEPYTTQPISGHV